MACVYTYKNKTYDKEAFVKILLNMKPAEASKYMPGVKMIPNAPFIGSTPKWTMLAFKRMVRYAAEQGMDKIAWTTGDMQAARYDLSKQVDEVEWNTKTNRLYAKQKGSSDFTKIADNVTENNIANYIGKDPAEKLVNQKVDYDVRNISGLDLKVGGSGMKGFYDKILPAEVNKFFGKKAWGKAKVGEIEFRTGMKVDIQKNASGFYTVRDPDGEILIKNTTKEKAQQFIMQPMKAWQLPITPQMRSKSLREGMPAYSSKPDGTPEGGNKELYEEARKYKTAREFVDSVPIKSRSEKREVIKKWKKDTGYKQVDSSFKRGGKQDSLHSPSDPESGSPLYDLTENGTYPDDVYSYNGLRYYGTGEDRMDAKAYGIISDAEGSPIKQVRVYRAVEKTDPQKIIPGDWVTTVRAYAKDHGDSTLKGGYKIISKKVTAKDIFTSGDSWLEFGYHPQPAIHRKVYTKNLTHLINLWDEANPNPPSAPTKAAPKYSVEQKKAENPAYLSAEGFIEGTTKPLKFAKTGIPITAKLYHGSPDARFADEFDADKPGYYPQLPEALPDNDEFISLHGGINMGFKGESVTGNKGVSFSDNWSTAKSYADKPAFDYNNSVPMVIERYVTLQNPKVYDLKGKKWHLNLETEMRNALDSGHDGLVFKNILDNYHPDSSKKTANNIIALDTTNIRTKKQLEGVWEDAKSKALREGMPAYSSKGTAEGGSLSAIKYLEEPDSAISGFGKGLTEIEYSGPVYHAAELEGLDYLLRNEIHGENIASTINSSRFFDRPVLVLYKPKKRTGKYAPYDADSGRNHGYDEFRTENLSEDDIEKVYLNDNLYGIWETPEKELSTLSDETGEIYDRLYEIAEEFAIKFDSFANIEKDKTKYLPNPPSAPGKDAPKYSVEGTPEGGNEPIFKTGLPVTFDYIHNKEKSPYMGSRFGQDKEPAGQYIQTKPRTFKNIVNWETGTVAFQNPIVIDWGGGYGEDTNWKNILSKKYGGKTGKKLSAALIADGHDGVVTIGKHGEASEIVNLDPNPPSAPAKAAPKYSVEQKKAETGKTSIRNIMSTLRKAATTKSDAVKAGVSKEQEMIDGYRKLEALAKDPQSSVATKQKMLASFLKILPTRVRAKVITPLSQISRYKQIKTHQKRIQDALNSTEKELVKYLRRDIIAKIEKGISPKKLAKNRIKKGTIGHEAERDLQFIRETLSEKDISTRMDSIGIQIDNKQAELEEADGDKAKIIEEEIANLQSHQSIMETFGGLKSQNLDDLLFAKESLVSIIEDGRALWRAQQDAFNGMLKPIVDNVQQDISGQDKPVVETAAEASQREMKRESAWGRAKGTWDAVENSILSWEFLLNKLSKLSSGKVLKSYTTAELGAVAQDATKQENTLNIGTDKAIHSNAKKIFKAESDTALNKKFMKMETKHTGTIFSYDEKGIIEDEFAMSQMEAAYMYAIRKNDDSLPTFKKMGMTDKTFHEIETFIGPELKEWVDFNVDEYLQDFHFSVNDIYRQVYGTNLTKTPGYISWYRNVAGKVQDKGIAASPHETGAKGMSKGAFKERQKNTNPYRLMGFNDVLTRHVAEMNNFKAWALPTKVINGVFNNRKTQRLITQHHSSNMGIAIKSFQADFTKAPIEMRGEMPWLDKLRGNITTAMTALNPTIFLKQLTSIPAMAESIPAKAWIKYETDFWANPMKAWRLLKDSKHWESRRTKGMERDIRTAQSVSGSQAVANVRNLKSRAMFLVKWGDGAAILVGGYPVYKYHFDKNLAQMGKPKAHEFAMSKFEEAMDRTQQASGVKDQGKFQRSGSYAKLFSMFMTAPKQYTSQITAAIRQIHSNPTDGDAYKRLFIFGVMMPSLFQATAVGLLGLVGGEDDDKDKFISGQIKAILQAPLNGIPIIRDLQKGVWESAMGEWYGTDVEYSPITEAGQSLLDAVFHGAKLVANDSDTPEQRSKQWSETINNLFETVGYAYGLPVETVRKMFMENWGDIVSGDTEYPVRRAIGFSRYAMNENSSRFQKEKRRLNKIKDRFDNTNDRAGFLKKHREDLRSLRRLNKIQGRLNKYTKRINRLLKKDGTEKAVKNLRERRAEVIKRFLAAK